jgi:hypothetical protein
MHLGGCLVRGFWMILGNVAVLFCAFAILRHRGSFLSVADAIFWAIVVCLGAARCLDVVKLRGHTASGEPASTVHLRRYLLFLVAVCAILWALAHAGAHFDVFTF